MNASRRQQAPAGASRRQQANFKKRLNGKSLIPI
jgi:hypothetical protein